MKFLRFLLIFQSYRVPKRPGHYVIMLFYFECRVLLPSVRRCCWQNIWIWRTPALPRSHPPSLATPALGENLQRSSQKRSHKGLKTLCSSKCGDDVKAVPELSLVPRVLHNTGCSSQFHGVRECKFWDGDLMPKAEASVRSLSRIHPCFLECSSFRGPSRDWDLVIQAAAKRAVIHYVYLCPR